jgi:hypothetical protein
MPLHPRARPLRSKPSVLVGCVLASTAVFLLAETGCATHSRQAARDEDAYAGPALSVDSRGPQHVVVITAPSAGWEITFDRAKPSLGFTEVYITARKPNPAYMHAQATVEQRLGSAVDAKTPIRVLVRVVDYTSTADAAPYRQAGASTR